MKRVNIRSRAQQDLTAAVDHYLNESNADVADAFLRAFDDARRHLAEFPASGSPRYGNELGIPNLRSWALSSFPYVVMYVDRHDDVDIWRVLHGRRDIPATLQES